MEPLPVVVHSRWYSVQRNQAWETDCGATRRVVTSFIIPTADSVAGQQQKKESSQHGSWYAEAI